MTIDQAQSVDDPVEMLVALVYNYRVAPSRELDTRYDAIQHQVKELKEKLAEPQRARVYEWALKLMIDDLLEILHHIQIPSKFIKSKTDILADYYRVAEHRVHSLDETQKKGGAHEPGN